MVLRQRICDICKKPMEFEVNSLIVKRKWALWYDTGWDKLDICPDCTSKMYEFIRRAKEDPNEFNSLGQ